MRLNNDKKGVIQLDIFQHIRETRESRKREREFKREIERIKKADDDTIREDFRCFN